MDRDRSWNRLRELFDQAVDLDPDGRRRLLEREAVDPLLRSRVEALLVAHDSGGDILDEPAAPAAAGGAPALAGDSIGPYRLLEQIGEGGFGVVFLAEQTKPFQRRVALKLLRADASSAQVLARFEAERQALALMDHPNIASVFDAGATPAGQPYFVMEYVDGAPITDFADAQRLPVEERLRLFLQLCEAVQHAHQKGVIHRDLKPSNVLVAAADDRPQVKVIDFGVAKALGARLTAETVYTQLGMLIGTPEYMSPEQADAGALKVDTRSDVYSLGVLLYELLVGARPLDRAALREAGLSAILRAIRETQPPRLSTRLAALGAEAAAVAAARRSDATTLARRLRGDLEWITLRALEKEPDRRYPSVGALAEDVAGALAGRAVSAHPPSAAYQLRKLVQRHRVGVAFAGTVFVLLLGFAVAMSMQYREQRIERLRAERMNAFLQTMMGSANPTRARGADVRMRDVLDAAAKELDALHDEPEVEGAAAMTMAYSYEMLSELEPAEALARRAIAAFTAAQGPEGRDALAARMRLASIFRSGGQADSAIALQEQVAGILAVRRGASPRDRANALGELGRSLQDRGDYDGALQRAEEALRILEDARLTDHELYGSVWNDLGKTYQSLGRIPDAERAYRAALESHRRLLGPDHPFLPMGMTNLASTLRAQRKYAEAETLLASAAVLQEKLLGPEHPGVASVYNSLGLLMKQQEKYAEAESLYRKSLDIRRRAYGEAGHPDVATSLNNLGVLYRAQGRLAEAEACYREALEVYRRAFGEEHPNIALCLNNISGLLEDQGKAAESEAVARQALAMREKLLGPDHPDTIKTQRTLGISLMRAGRPAEAEALLSAAMERSGADSVLVSLAAVPRGECLVTAGRAKEAEPLFARWLPVFLEHGGGATEAKLRYLGLAAASSRAAGRDSAAAAFAADSVRLATSAPTGAP